MFPKLASFFYATRALVRIKKKPNDTKALQTEINIIYALHLIYYSEKNNKYYIMRILYEKTYYTEY